MDREPIVIELLGPVPSKKNKWGPRRGGGIGITDEATQTAIDRLEMQVPARARDLKLESPEMEITFRYVRADWDRDNALTTILDVLRKQGVIANDNIRRFNGKLTIWPAEPAEYPGVKIVLIPAAASEEGGATRYVNPRRQRRAPLAALAGSIPGIDAPPLARAGSLDSFPEFEDEEETPWDD